MATVEAWGEAGRKYVIHEETLSYFRRMRELGSKSYLLLTPEELRAQYLRRAEVFAGTTDFRGEERHLVVPREEGETTEDEGVPVSVYIPHDVGRAPPILIYFHGGGYVGGSRNMDATFLKIIAKRARCVVVNVEYRLAPEHKAPAAFHDCRDVTRWVLRHKTEVGGAGASQVGVGGESVGGTLVALVTHHVTGLAFQIPVYPVTELTFSSPSYQEFAITPGLNKDSMMWFADQFLSSEEQKADPIVCPGLVSNTDLVGLPPALCILAQLDPLRDEGQAYFERLREAGVETEIVMAEGAPHGFFLYADHFKQLTKEPYDKIVTFIQRFQQ